MRTYTEEEKSVLMHLIQAFDYNTIKRYDRIPCDEYDKLFMTENQWLEYWRQEGFHYKNIFEMLTNGFACLASSGFLFDNVVLTETKIQGVNSYVVIQDLRYLGYFPKTYNPDEVKAGLERVLSLESPMPFPVKVEYYEVPEKVTMPVVDAYYLGDDIGEKDNASLEGVLQAMTAPVAIQYVLYGTKFVPILAEKGLWAVLHEGNFVAHLNVHEQTTEELLEYLRPRLEEKEEEETESITA